MNKLAKASMSMVAAGLLAAGLSGAAQASVLATAVAELNNFRILGSNGIILNAASDFKTFAFTSTGGYAGTLNGTPGYNAASSATPVNLPAVCVGSGCNATFTTDNLFQHVTTPAVGNLSAADQNEAGSPIAGIAGLPPPAIVQNAAYAQLTTQTALSHSTSTNNLNSNFTFQLAQPTPGLTFNFNVNVYLDVAVSGNEISPGFATASYA